MNVSHKPGIRSTASETFAQHFRAVLARCKSAMGLSSPKPARGMLKGNPKAAAAAKGRPSSQSAAVPATKAKPAPVSVVRDEDSDDELFDDGHMAAARQRERARCQAIIGCEAAEANRALAFSLAFTTRMTRTEAIAMLQQAPACPEPDRYNQARADRNPRVGSPISGEPPVREIAANRMHAALAAEMARTQGQGHDRASTGTK